MSLSFLAKKAWHTSNVKNVEKVWLAEQEHAKEEKRLKELRKQIDEERQIDELRAMQRDNGLVTDPKQKVEWMYEGPGSAITSAAAAEEYKLGKEFVPTSAASALRELESKNAVGSTWLDKSATDANEQFSRLNQDPLLTMRQAHKTELDRHVLKNPLVMKRLKTSLADQLREYEQRRKAKKEAKKAAKKLKKKDKKRKKKKHSEEGSSDEEQKHEPQHEEVQQERRGWGLQKGERSTEPRALGPPADMLEARAREEAARQGPPRKRQNWSEEELEQLRSEMAADAAAHDANRLERMRHHRNSAVKECIEEDDVEMKKRRQRSDENEEDEDVEPRFIRSVRRDAFGESATMDLEESVQRSRNRHQKKRRAEDFF